MNLEEEIKKIQERNKRVELDSKHILDIQNMYFEFEENEHSKIFENKETVSIKRDR